MTEEVYRCFQAILEDREPPAFEQMIDGHVGFLYLDDQGLPYLSQKLRHRPYRRENRLLPCPLSAKIGSGQPS